MRVPLKVSDCEKDELIKIIGTPLSPKQEFEKFVTGAHFFTPEDHDFINLIAKKYCAKPYSIWIEKVKGDYIVTAEPSWKIL